jgi:hypothetical protein
VNQVKLACQRLADASGVPGVLAVSWEVFELIAAVASAAAGQSPDMYPAFTFASGAAVSGRNALAFAPSLPPVPGDTKHSLPEPAGGVQETADALAALASALSRRLRASAGLAAGAADRSACENAAGEADRITQLLARGD